MPNGLARYAAASAAAILLAACASYEQPVAYWTVDGSAFQRLVPGKTTAAEVRRQLGAPETVNRFERKGEDVWQYHYLEAGFRVMYAYVHFDLNGVYRYTFRTPDPDLNGETNY